MGLLWVVKETGGAIYAFCLACHADEFLIHNWEQTDWADGPMESVEVEEVFEVPDDAHRETVVVERASSRGGRSESGADPLKRALGTMESPLTASEVRAFIATADTPMAVVDKILASLSAPRLEHAVAQVLPVLIEVWNSTPRPELGGRTPASVHHQARRTPTAAKAGHNAPCPCGSGKKYEKCCGTN